MERPKSSFETEQYFQDIADNIEEVVFLANLDFKVLYINKAYEEVSGLSLASLRKDPTSWINIMVPEDRTRFFAFATERIKTGSNDSITYRIKKPNGSIRIIHMRVVIIKNDAGMAYRFAGIVSDITEQNKNEENLVKLKKAIDISGDVIFMTDVEGMITFINTEFTKLYGYTAEEVIGKKTPRILKSGLKANEEYEAFWKDILSGKTVKQEVANRARNGDVVVIEETVNPIFGHEQKIEGFLAIQRDLTQQKIAEKALRESETETLELRHELDLGKAKEEIVSLAAHQLRSPLAAIKGYVSLMLTNNVNAPSEEQKHILEKINETDKKMIDLINGLLNASRVELGTFAINPTPTNMPNLIDAQLEELAVTTREKKQIVVKHIGPGLESLNLDPRLILIVLQNLLSNAIKYTPAGGTITITAKKDDWIEISVADTGIGIPKEQQSKVFTKLFRADNAQQADASGTGLGLYLTKAIVEASEGKIWFESKENGGTTFHITIPSFGMKKREGNKGLV